MEGVIQSKVIKSTQYCDLIAQGISQEGNDISAVEKIYIHSIKREEIRFAWYKNEGEVIRFVPRPLDLTEEELLKLLKSGFENDVFTDAFELELRDYLLNNMS
ncbi:hypothetical protein LG307_03415 [Sutcliffiella horikoshii]|uniref:hypothetical protein n=1 Tax=Sutcliffiella horikoshii TaxID=79883 RepID=UPI0038500B3B